MTDPAPPTRPVSIVHPSWGVHTEAVEEPSGSTALRHGAHSDPDDLLGAADGHFRLGPTAIVIVIAMFCVTLAVAVVSLFGDPRGGAFLAGAVVLIGTVMAWVFKDRWV